MGITSAAAVDLLERAYVRDGDDPPFARLLESADENGDDEFLAELIEADGRRRLGDGLPVSLERYLQAVDDLPARPVALDAAIDIALRAISNSAHVSAQAVEALIRDHPDLAGAIREAAALNNAIWSTATLQSRMAERTERDLPCDFGPPLSDGRLRFELRELLGLGSSGRVYLAVDRHLSEHSHEALVAIKLMARTEGANVELPHAADEATKARRVNHPNVVRVLDRGVIDGDEFIVYDYVDGGDLTVWIDRCAGRVLVRDAVLLMVKIARGVQAAHAAGLIHCDLKPGNIMMTSQGEPRVADFGIAIRAGESVISKYTATDETPIGNLAFISPEQYRMEEGALAAPSDVYALGGILYYMLTGALPNGATAAAIGRTHDAGTGRSEPPSARATRREIDRDLDLICRRAMAVDPRDRTSAAASFADDLESWLRREPLYWTRPSLLHVVQLWVKRRPGIAAALMVIIVSLLAGGFFALQAKYERDQRTALIDLAGGFGDMLHEVNQARPPSARLSRMAWMLEYFFSPQMLAKPIDSRGVWLAKLDNVEKSIAQAQAEGRGDQLLPLLWKMTAAFWLLGDGQYDRAQPHLDSAEAALAEMLTPDDRMLGVLDALGAAAIVQRIHSRASAELGAEDLARLREAEGRITRQEAVLAESDPGAPVHVFLLEMLIELNGEDLLDRPDARTELEAKLEASQARRFIFMPG